MLADKHATHAPQHPNNIGTKYRVVQECLNFFSDGTPLLYVYPTHYDTHDEAFAVMENAARSSIAVHNNNPADFQHEFFGDEYKTEVFYHDADGNKIIVDRYLVCEIQEIEVPRQYNNEHYYTYRRAAIRHNKQNNRFFILGPSSSKIVTRHTLKNACEYIDRLYLKIR